MRPIPILRKPVRSGRVRFAPLIAVALALAIAVAGGALASTPVPEASLKTVVKTAADLPQLGYRLPVAREQPTPLGARSTDGVRNSVASPDIAR